MIVLQILTPGRTLEKDTVDSVSLPTFTGEITILPHHVPLITALRAGVVTVRKGKQEKYFAVSTGIVKVDSNGISILADTAERADELLEEQVAQARDAAQKAMTEKRADSVEYAQAIAMLEREHARLTTVRRFRRSGSSAPRSVPESSQF